MQRGMEGWREKERGEEGGVGKEETYLPFVDSPSTHKKPKAKLS